MSRHRLSLLVLVVLAALLVAGSLSGCDLLFQVRLMPTQPAPIEAPQAAPSPTEVPPSPTAAPPSPTLVPTEPPPSPTEVSPTEAPSPTEVMSTEVVSATLDAPELQEVPDEYVGSVVDLVWTWTGSLAEDEWFELYIWPDQPDVEPEVYGWYKEPPVRVTAANLLPGRYRWSVIVVKGRGEDRGEEMSPVSEEWRFTIVRPSVIGDISVPSPVMPTKVPTNTPTPTNTPRPWFPSATPVGSVTATPTRVPSTSTPTPAGPTATSTPEGYPPVTETTAPATVEPTATTEPYPPTTEEPTVAPTAAASNTPAPKPPTNTPVPASPVPTSADPTAYPG